MLYNFCAYIFGASMTPRKENISMKTTKVLLLSLGMALCVGGGIGAAVAITRQAAGNTGSSAFDKAVNLYWEAGEASTTLTDMESLSVNVPQYRYLTVSPKSSASVSGNVKLTFTLAEATVEEKTAVLKGLTVSVEKILDQYFTGKWDAELKNTCQNLGADENATGLPTADGSWRFATWTKAQYTEVFNKIATGTLAVDATKVAAVGQFSATPTDGEKDAVKTAPAKEA